MIVVLGMHRSGTSALTGVLAMLGAEAGHNLISGDSTNPKGFWENSEIVDIHHQLLEEMGSSWDDISPLPEGWWNTDTAGAYANRIREVLERDFSAARLAIIKDPRTCRVLPLWLRILSELGWDPVFVLSLRHPIEVAQSMQKRDHIDPDRGCLLWLNHTVSAEHRTRGKRRALVLYPDLLENWRAVVQAVADELSLPLFPVSELAEREV
ncbi:MAG: sulfotransferase family protein, partial [Acidobacteriota bacterium]